MHLSQEIVRNIIGGSSEIPCGVPHIDDMSFTFQIFPIVNTDLKVSQRMVQYFVNFAYYGMFKF